VIESTINPGVSDEVIAPLLNELTKLELGKDYNLAHCPERINPGDNKWTIYNIPRNIASINQRWNKEIADFYRSFVQAEINEVSTLKVAEATKIVENTFRDINIAFVNELAKSFEAMGIDVVETIEGAANKPFAFMAHWPSVGVGGHCIPVDPYYLIKRAAASGFNHRFLKLAREINNSMPEFTIDILSEELNELGLPVKNTKIGLYGLSYKANVGDLRESPSLIVREELQRLGADLTVFDPYVDSESDVSSLKELIDSVDVLLIATNHDEIVELDLNEFSDLKLILDGKNCLSTNELNKLGINYKGIGR
jgi:nucleotide sugar dehydrogenase